MAGMSELILYSTPGCHLCELAEAEVDAVITQGPWRLREVDITDDQELMRRYGVRIPVLFDPTNQRELSWPFDRYGVERFLQS